MVVARSFSYENGLGVLCLYGLNWSLCCDDNFDYKDSSIFSDTKTFVKEMFEKT